MMKRMGFGAKIVAVIMRCISTPSFSVVINGRVGGKIIPKRGLLQGCPLSPYLFLICAEGLSALIRGQERLGLLRGFRVVPGPLGSHISYLPMIASCSVKRVKEISVRFGAFWKCMKGARGKW